LTVIIFLPLYRVFKGPTVFDRMLGAGAIGTKTMVLILAIGFLFNRLDMFVDAVWD
jgi:multicomponent Na+:H+ antiporter subunit F